MSNPYRIQQDTVNNLEGSLDDKQDKLTAGTGITIDENNVISAEVVSAPEWGDITGTLSNQTDLNTALNGKQDTLTAGTGIDITNNVISCNLNSAVWGNITGTLSNQTDLNTILESKADETELNSHINNSTVHVSSTDKSNWNGKQDALTAGTGIDIENNVISCTVTGAVWGDITGTLANQTDLNTALAGKASASDLTSHTSDTNIHVSSTDKTAWNAKTVVTIRRW